jgi:hypothetical protein
VKITELKEGDLVIIRRNSDSQCECHICFFRKDRYPKSGKEYTAEVVGIEKERERVYLLCPKRKGIIRWNSVAAQKLNVPKHKQLQHDLDLFAAAAIVRKVAGNW